MSTNEVENLRMENLRLWALMNRLEQELSRLRQGLGARGVSPVNFGSNTVTATLLTIDIFRETAEDLAGEFEKLRQGMAERGLDLDKANMPGTLVDAVLAWIDVVRSQQEPTQQLKPGVWVNWD